MEEAWELAVVSEDLAAEEPFNESGLKFVEINEFALRYYLRRLDNYVSDFTSSYEYLRDLSKGAEANLPSSSDVWTVVIDCAEDLAGIANILSPSRKGKKDDLKISFTKKRAESLQGLLQLNVNDRKNLVDFRNRVHHEDEDFDDWFFRHMTTEANGSARIIMRLVTWGVSPLTTDAYACASGYDAKNGHVHFYDKHYNLHEAMRIINLIKSKLNDAGNRLTELSGRKSDVEIV